MSTQDKILETIKTHPAISCEQIFQELKKDPEFKDSFRTVQRHLSTLHKNGLVKTNAIGKTALYSLGKSEQTSPNDYFFVSVWRELFQIVDKFNNNDNAYTAAFYSLLNLERMLPAKMKSKLDADFEKILNRIVNSQSAEPILFDWNPTEEEVAFSNAQPRIGLLARSSGSTVKAVPYTKETLRPSASMVETKNPLVVSELIGKLSQVLHEGTSC